MSLAKTVNVVWSDVSAGDFRGAQPVRAWLPGRVVDRLDRGPDPRGLPGSAPEPDVELHRGRQHRFGGEGAVRAGGQLPGRAGVAGAADGLGQGRVAPASPPASSSTSATTASPTTGSTITAPPRTSSASRPTSSLRSTRTRLRAPTRSSGGSTASSPDLGRLVDGRLTGARPTVGRIPVGQALRRAGTQGFQGVESYRSGNAAARKPCGG